MTWQTVAADALLVVGVGIELLCAVGMLVMEDVYDRLHFLGPASSLGPIALAGAVVLQQALSTAGIKAILIAAVLLISGPVATHAKARAARIREHGQWGVEDDTVTEYIYLVDEER